jgi:hypothetical protein
MDYRYRRIVEAAGGHILGMRTGVVYFAVGPGRKPLSLYCFACESRGVRLALKSQREQMLIDHWQDLV